MPLTILNFSRAWRAHFLSNTLQTWQSCLFFVDLQLISLSLLDTCDYIEFEKSEKAFLSICSELFVLSHEIKALQHNDVLARDLVTGPNTLVM